MSLSSSKAGQNGKVCWYTYQDTTRPKIPVSELMGRPSFSCSLDKRRSLDNILGQPHEAELLLIRTIAPTYKLISS
jgi:hypothetical protein